MVETTTASTTAGEGSVERAFRLLQTIVAAGESTGIRELSRRSGLPRSTVSRLAATLTDLGMVDRTSDGSVRPGSALATLQPESPSLMLSDQLRPLLSELAQTVGENAALSVDDGDALLYLDQVRADNPVSVPDVTSERRPFHLVAPGLLAMSWWDPLRLDRHLAGDLVMSTGLSMTNPSKLRTRVELARQQRFAWTDQELDIGVNGLAVPVVDEEDALLATVSLYGPSYRFSPEARPDLAATVGTLVAARSSSLVR